MEIINRENIGVRNHKKTSQISLITVRDTKTLYLSYAAVSEFGLTAHNYIHFIFDEGRWFFMTNTSSTGFMMYRSHGERWNAGFNIHSVPAISSMLAKSSAKTKESYRLRKTDLKFENTYDLIEILFKNPARKEL